MKTYRLSTLLLGLVMTLAVFAQDAPVVPADVLDIASPQGKIDSLGWTKTQNFYAINGVNLIINAYTAYQSKATQNWIDYTASGSLSGVTWDSLGIFKGSEYYGPENGGTNYRCAAMRSNRAYSFRVKHCVRTELYIKPVGYQKEFYLRAYEVVSDTINPTSPSKEEVLLTDLETFNTEQVMTLTGLSRNKEYVIVVTSNDAGNCYFYEIAFAAPAPGTEDDPDEPEQPVDDPIDEPLPGPDIKDTVAYFAFPETEYMSATGGTDVPGVNCTATFNGIGNKASNAQVVNGVLYLKMTTDASSLTLYPAEDNKVQPGDSVFVRLNHSSARTLGVYLKTKGGTLVNATQGANNEEVIAKAKISRDDINDDGSLSFVRIDGNSTFVRSFLVTRNPNAPKPRYYYVTYFNQNGKKIGIDSIATANPALRFRFGLNDLPSFAASNAFRGWYTSKGRKLVEGEVLEEDINLYAKVTPIEQPTSSAFYAYDLTERYFYPEDHECIAITGGSWKSANEGWFFESGSQIKLAVSPQVYIETVGTETNVNFYENLDTVTINFAAPTTLKSVSIYNVMQSITQENGYYMIPANDVNNLLMVIRQLQDGDKIFLPNGVYDLGEKALTRISANNVSIIGQSTNGVIIKNAPDYAMESINQTATLYLTGTNIYLQDLTIQNALDFYKNGNGRAVALWAQCDRSICKNVCLLSHQDTYYSQKKSSLHYWENGEIHGSTDYICGNGTVYFRNVLLYCEKRYESGGGQDALAASNANPEDKGYIFDSCRIQSECPVVSLGRLWGNSPQCVYLNTTLDYSAGNFSLNGVGIQRWTNEIMNPDAWPGKDGHIGEFNTMDTNGNIISPASNLITFSYSSSARQYETILSAEQAAEYSYDNIVGTWNPAEQTAQQVLSFTQENDAIQWGTTTASVFLIEHANGETEIVDELPVSLAAGDAVRAANARGGFGPAAVVQGELQAIESVPEQTVATKIIRGGQLLIIREGKVFNAMGMELE